MQRETKLKLAIAQIKPELIMHALHNRTQQLARMPVLRVTWFKTICMNQVCTQHQADGIAIGIGHEHREKVLDSRANLTRHLVKTLARLVTGGLSRLDRRRYRLEPIACALHEDGNMYDEARERIAVDVEPAALQACVDALLQLREVELGEIAIDKVDLAEIVLRLVKDQLVDHLLLT